MSDKVIRGAYAALLTPRCDDGKLDLPSLRSLIAFQRSHGINRFAINGATGEFCSTTPAELRLLLAAIRAEAGSQAEILCGVGAAGIEGTKSLVRVAEQANVQGLLLSMPYFFRYNEEDLYAFSAAAASSTTLPILLYNLPQFASGLNAAVVCRLVEEVPNIVGVKDSSGSLEIMDALTGRLPQASRIVGNDSALAPALTQGLCDGVVSGVACVLPELITELFSTAPGSDSFQRLVSALDAFIDQLNILPTPWGLKVAAQARGVLQAQFSLPLSEERSRQIHSLEEWLHHQLPRMLAKY